MNGRILPREVPTQQSFLEARISAAERALEAEQPGTLADRARGEHLFRVIEQLWGFGKFRYRGIAKEPGPGADHVRAGQALPSSQPLAPRRNAIRTVSKVREATALGADHSAANHRSISLR